MEGCKTFAFDERSGSSGRCREGAGEGAAGAGACAGATAEWRHREQQRSDVVPWPGPDLMSLRKLLSVDVRRCVRLKQIPLPPLIHNARTRPAWRTRQLESTPPIVALVNRSCVPCLIQRCLYERQDCWPQEKQNAVMLINAALSPLTNIRADVATQRS